VQRVVGSELAIRAAIVAERVDQLLECGLDLRGDAVARDVREADREVGEEALELLPLPARGSGAGAPALASAA
jgi:hypothetical protein